MAIAFSMDDSEDDNHLLPRQRRIFRNSTILRFQNNIFHLRSPPSREETERTAQILFTQFYRETFNHEGVQISDQEALQAARQTDDFAQRVMASVGRDLRQIAEQLERSHQREEIRQKAREVELRIESYDRYFTLLRELFPNGIITREGIVVLFFFCSDVALLAYTRGFIEYFNQIITWSLDFIFQFICSWVQEKGGWERVLGFSISRTAVTVCAILGSIALLTYLKKHF